MKEFENLDEIREDWKKGHFEFPERMLVSGIPYQIRHGSKTDFLEVIKRKSKPYLIYQTSSAYYKSAKRQGLERWIMFIWGMGFGYRIIPHDVRPMSPQFLGGSGGSGGAEDMSEATTEYIGDVVILKVQLPSGVGVLKGKVDTGAEISSLHAEPGWKIVGDNVKFVNGHLSKSIITVPIADRQAVSSADGGTEYRPVVALDVTVNDKPVRNALFNLNDRSQMEYPALIGQNILDKTKFVINTRMNDNESPEAQTEDAESDVDWELLHQNVAATENIMTEEADSETIRKIAQMLSEANFSFGDLLRTVRTQALEQLETLED